MAAYLANVGANAAHRLRSPLRADGTFTVYPILEVDAELRARELWNPR